MNKEKNVDGISSVKFALQVYKKIAIDSSED